MKPNLLFIVFFAFCSLISLSTVESDLASDRDALLALRQSVGGRALLWNVSDSPCRWVGVTCQQDRVVVLRLPGMGLSGQLPIAIGNLTQLHTLSLRFNALTGSIPSDIALLASLRNLYLQGNLFSGEIPDTLFSLQNLVRLNLAKNNFSGVISPGFNNLTRLATLYLEENHLSGSIPDLNLKLDQFNVSFNNLTGSIPNGLSSQPDTAFVGNPLCGKPLLSCNGTVVEGGKKLSGGAIAGIAIGSVIAFLLILMILIFLCRNKRGDKSRSMDVELGKQKESKMPREEDVIDSGNVNANIGLAAAVRADGKGSSGSKSLVFFGNTPSAYDLEDLLRASAEVLGKGTFGTTYKATLEVGMVVAVKRLKDLTVSEKEYREKIEAVGKMDHENLVPLRAYYYSRDEKLLVFDFMSMGSLSALLHGNRDGGRTPLNWETRSGIALGAAKGIEYIHSQGPARSHGNIKSSNILLTNSFEAHVSDFGLAPLSSPASTPNRIDGYRAPEVTDSRKISQKADVYSFGIFLLELLTGKAPTHALLNEEGVDLPRWVQSVVKDEWSSEVFDLELLRYQNVEEAMVQLLQLAIDCTTQYPDKRPSMMMVRSRIQELSQGNLQDEHVVAEDTYLVDSGAPPP